MLSYDKWWEPKISELLTPDVVPWFHKCPDARHGGQVKLDFIGITFLGRFFAIEVKSIDRLSREYHVVWEKKGDEGPTPLQRQSLEVISRQPNCQSFVAVGYKHECIYFLPWSIIRNVDTVLLTEYPVLDYSVRGKKPIPTDLAAIIFSPGNVIIKARQSKEDDDDS